MSARRLIILSTAVVLTASAGAVFSAQATGDKAWDLLREILMVPGISSQEKPAADWIQARLPKGVKVERDAKHNVWFTVGSGKPHILFVAHTDELGMTVEAISPDGIVKLKGRGGFLPQALEGRPFVIQTAKGPVEGIILPRPDYMERAPKPFAPAAYELFLGVSSEKEARGLGVAEGQAVIYKKKIIDLTDEILAARAVDDRAGCAAVLAAVLELDLAAIKDRTVTFAWDVEEEIGLFGATELSKVLKPDYVFAVDTFVSSDDPLDNRRFGYAPLGKGLVFRAMDSSNLVPKPELQNIISLAERKGIPYQVSNSRGGNDGSVFLAGGAVDIPLSWPGAHAHSFIEKIVKSDLRALTDLIKAIALEFTGLPGQIPLQK
ncbi:MAG: M20/M25/M40 family metallo-hydrolase [Candidatus Aminicenantes bacterium]|nr:M20/M25/M40 family metallo-hydrolase [Candidatus Aminicenantes bacterium]